MCIIAVKKEGVDMPTNQIIKKMFSSNSDGAGFMVKRKRSNTISLHKGLMTLEEFSEALSNAKIKQSDIVVMHFRIATVGGKSQQLTHPFICDLNPDVINVLETKTSSPCLVHNGTINSLKGSDLNKSDSSRLANLVFSSEAVYNNLDDTAIQVLLDELLAGTRVALINPLVHEVEILGEWAKSDSDYKWNQAEGGMIYSNHSWIPPKANVYNGYGGSYYGSGERWNRIGFDSVGRGRAIDSKDSYNILKDWDEISAEFQVKFLTFMELSETEFMELIAAGMSMDEYIKDLTSFMNYMGMRTVAGFTSEEAYNEIEEHVVAKSGFPIKTADGWNVIETKTDKKK